MSPCARTGAAVDVALSESVSNARGDHHIANDLENVKEKSNDENLDPQKSNSNVNRENTKEEIHAPHGRDDVPDQNHVVGEEEMGNFPPGDAKSSTREDNSSPNKVCSENEKPSSASSKPAVQDDKMVEDDSDVQPASKFSSVQDVRVVFSGCATKVKSSLEKSTFRIPFDFSHCDFFADGFRVLFDCRIGRFREGCMVFSDKP